MHSLHANSETFFGHVLSIADAEGWLIAIYSLVAGLCGRLAVVKRRCLLMVK